MIYRENEYLEPLGGVTRLKESTFGAAGKIARGIRGMVTGFGGRVKGVLKTLGGLLDIGDIGISAVADATRSLAGTPKAMIANTRFHTMRALQDFKNIRTDDPLHVIHDSLAYTVGLLHGLFKTSNDGLTLAKSAVG